ncbi:type I glutamate--ammonia ligase [Candidatus Neoehrlichia procyonis]|uniref:Glutamine synthetase, catalytic domain protein n=1 Tax=Candidatus Neoehrlichia procyonis str. RAC413 TaxID=1359163 RepID=A0A0F3NRK7_9RICK|nr:glutamine synthetase [Candidatus Neoehrlichia lotoris]KJV69539.1 glutamine synthetase, catalytic domain protein [Candidatus Neoehrlichia lotoris str. RAC413]
MLHELLSYLIKKLKIIPEIGVELEFYFSKIEEHNLQSLIDIISSKITQLSCQITKEAHHFQYEIQTYHSNKIENLITDLLIVKEIIQEYTASFGGKANFFAKPYLNKAGNAFHIHVNLLNLHNENLFFNHNNCMSNTLLYCIGGLCSSIKKHMIFFAPRADSYLRYIHADINTPTTISWGGNNRSVAIRLPNITNNLSKCRIEHRVPGADCNYQNTVIAILQGIIHGIENKILPIPKTYGIASDPQYKLEKLPLNLQEATALNKQN